MLREAPRAIAEWVTEDPLPEITLAEVDRRPAMHPVPITGWRRLMGVALSVLAGMAIVAVAAWILWQGAGVVDRAIERTVGRDAVGPDTIGTVPLTPSDNDTAVAGVGPGAESRVDPGRTATDASSQARLPTLTWEHHGMAEGLPPGDVAALAVAPDGSVWAAVRASTQVRAAVYADRTWHRTSGGLEDVVGTPSWIAVDAVGSVWMAVTTADGSDRIVGFDGSTWAAGDTPVLWGTVVAEGDAGGLWVAGVDRRMRPALLEWADGEWVSAYGSATLDIAGATEPAELTPGSLQNRVVLDDAGTAWFAGDTGIARFDGRRLTLSEMGASWLALDAGGDVWAPTPRGLRTHERYAWSYFDARHGLPGTDPVAGSVRFGIDHTWAAFPEATGPVGYASSGSGWEQIPDPPPGSGLAFVPSYAPRLVYTPAALAAAVDRVWLSSNGRWAPVTAPDGDPLSGVLDVCRAPDGTFWIATESGLLALSIGDR